MIIDKTRTAIETPTRASTYPAYKIVQSSSKGGSSEYKMVKDNISTKCYELNHVLESVNNISEFEKRAEFLRDILLDDKTALSEQEMLNIQNIFYNSQQLINANREAGQLILLSLARLLEPLIENSAYSQEVVSIVKTLLKSQVKVLRYAALDIIAAGLGVSPVADQLLEEAKNLLKNEETGYVLDYLGSL